MLPEPPGGSTHPEVAAAVRRAADVLADDGFKVTEAVPPGYEQAIELWSTILTADLRVLKPVLDELMGPAGRQFLGYALEYLPPSDLASWALGTPAAVVPAGMADGLPVGVRVMGGKYTELRCLAVAEAIEQRLGPLAPLTPIDPVTD